MPAAGAGVAQITQWRSFNRNTPALSIEQGNEAASTFPTTPLPVFIEMYIAGEWKDITDYVRATDGIRIRRGFPDEGSTPEPSSCTLTLDNRDGRFSPRNPTGPYYGQIGRNTQIRVRAVLPYIPAGNQTRFIGEISAWPVRWDVSGRDGWVQVTAQGVLRRLNQSTSNIMGPLTQQALRSPSSFVHYWPMTDSGGQFASGFSGGLPIVPSSTDITYASDSTLAGSNALPVFGSTGYLQVSFQASSLSGEWQWAFFVAYSGTPSSTVTLADVSVAGGSVGRVLVTADASTVTIAAYDTLGALIASNSSANVWAQLFSGDWAMMTVYGSSVDTFVGTSGRVAGSSLEYGIEATSASIVSAGYPIIGTIPSSSVLNNAALGQMFVNSSGFPWAVGTETGKSGESAGARVSRLATLEGLTATVPVASTQTMGPQPAPSTFLDALNETWAADDGYLYETRDTLGITFRTNASLVNQPATLTLNYTGAGEISPDLEPSDDDQLVRNDVTVSRASGSFARYVDSTSIMGTEDPPDGVGTYDRSDTVNIDNDDDLIHHAAWRVHLGTWDEARYPAVRINMAALASHAKTELMAATADLDIGDRLQLTNMPVAWAGRSTVDLQVIGFDEYLGHPNDWDITANTRPYGPFDIGVLSGTSGDTWDMVGRAAEDEACAIRTAIDSTTTSIVIDPNFMRWTTDSDDLTPPIPVAYGGETGTVSAVATTAGSYVAIGTAVHADNAAVVPGLYSGHAANDLIILVARFRSTGSLTTPAGYTLIASNTFTSVWAKVDSGAEVDPTVTPSGGSSGDTLSAYTFGLRNTSITLSDLTDIVWTSAKRTNASGQNILFPNIDPSPYDGCFLLLIAGKHDDWTSVAQPTGWTEILDTSTTTGNDQGIYAAYILQTTHTPVVSDTLVVTGGAGAVSESLVLVIPAGYQTLTVARSTNGIVKSHTAGTLFQVDSPLIGGL